jgi:diguanylate cyclase (GGDEF)-like protein
VGTGREVQYLLEDCDSLNGTFVAGKQVSVPTLVTEGVRVGFGRRSLLRFSVQDALEERALFNVHESALRDGLTRAYNRRVFDDRLISEFAYSSRHNRPLSLMLFDIDHFKKVNDTHGHQAGDLVLQAVARQIASALRTEDVFARYGGEEFAIIARDTTLSEATVVAERIRALVGATETPWNGGSLKVTLSVGVACNFPIVPDVGLLVSKADAALYRAKARGRDRVEATALVQVKG